MANNVVFICTRPKNAIHKVVLSRGVDGRKSEKMFSCPLLLEKTVFSCTTYYSLFVMIVRAITENKYEPDSESNLSRNLEKQTDVHNLTNTETFGILRV